MFHHFPSFSYAREKIKVSTQCFKSPNERRRSSSPVSRLKRRNAGSSEASFCVSESFCSSWWREEKVSSGKQMVISPTAWREFRGCWWLMIARCWFICNSFMLCGRYFQLVHGVIIQLKTGGCTALYLGKTSPATKNCGFHQICEITNHDSTPGMGIPWPLAAHPVRRVIRSMYRPIRTSAMYPLVMTSSLLLKMAIYSEFSHEIWWFSIAMLSLPEGKCSILWTNKGEIYPWEYNANHNGDIMGHTVWAVMSRPLFPYPMLTHPLSNGSSNWLPMANRINSAFLVNMDTPWYT